jgi:hypothetical protein
MKANVGSTDKIIRYTIAVLMVALYATGTLTGTWGYVALGVAAIAVVTSLVSFCGLYAVLGISTCKVEPGK